MDNFIDAFLLKLPRELLFLIFSYLPKSFDTIQLVNAHLSLKNALQELSFINSVDFNNEYRLNLTNWKSIFTNDFSHVVSFNINNVYWIPVEEIRNSVKKMPNLSHFFAIDTQFTANKENCQFIKTHCLKLETLAISIECSDFYENTVNVLPPLKIVYIHVKKRYMSMREVLDIPPGYEKFLSHLVFVDYNGYPEFVTHYEYYNHTTQRPINFKKHRSKWEELLKNTIGFNSEKDDRIPFGIVDIKNIEKNNYNLENVALQEFRCCHCTDSNDIDCTSFNYKLQYELICSKSAKYLKKLSIQFCTIFDDIVESFFNEKSTLKIKPEDYTFQRIIKNCNKLEEIEIWDCKKYNTYFINHYGKYLPYDIDDNPNLEKQFMEELNYITNLNNLKKLSLINIPLNIAKYDCLETILKECKKLEYLNVTISHLECLAENKLFVSLPHASKLRDLRFNDPGLCINSLLTVLNSAEFPKLQRLYINSNADTISMDILRNFLERNPQLIFFAIYNYTLRKEEMEDIQKVMNKYKKDEQKVFCIGNCWVSGGCMVDLNQLKMDAPAIHKKDLVQENTKICVYNYFEDTSSIKSLFP